MPPQSFDLAVCIHSLSVCCQCRCVSWQGGQGPPEFPSCTTTRSCGTCELPCSRSGVTARHWHSTATGSCPTLTLPVTTKSRSRAGRLCSASFGNCAQSERVSCKSDACTQKRSKPAVWGCARLHSHFIQQLAARLLATAPHASLLYDGHEFVAQLPVLQSLPAATRLLRSRAPAATIVIYCSVP